jgi:lysozyme
MTTSEKGVAFIKRHEGFVPHLYNDLAGHCTVGYGHLVHLGPIDGRAEEQPYAKGITEPHADELLRQDIRARAEHYIVVWVKVRLSQNMFDALCSFIYNLGGHEFATSTLLKKLNNGDYKGAAEQFERWDHAGGREVEGLKERRDEEAVIFLTSDATTGGGAAEGASA